MQIDIGTFEFTRRRTRTYDVQNDPNTILSAIASLICPPGTIIPTMGSTEPGPGWKLCNGQALLKADFPRLFGIIGAEFGETLTTFALPDLRGRMPFGAGGAVALLDFGGAASLTLSVGQLPVHSHAVTDPGHAHGITDPGHLHTAAAPATNGTSGAAAGAVSGSTAASTTGVTVNSAATGITLGSVGSGDAVPILPPYIAVNWMVRT